MYWGVNYWSSDPWRSPQSNEYGTVCADGSLTYPGEEAGMAVMLPSLRLKAIRDGVYDYDYIQLLKNAGYEEWVMETVHEVAVDFKNWNQSPEVLEAARIKMGEKLSSLTDGQ